MKRIIIFHISQLGGHKKAGENIKEALEFKRPLLKVFNLNIFDYISPLLEKNINLLYGFTIKYLPRLWGGIYDRKSLVKILTPLRGMINRYILPQIYKLVKETNPSLILATQAFPCGVVADLKRIYKWDLPLIGVITDYCPHRFWIHPQVDFYTVASEKAKEILRNEGVEEEKIKVMGIPVSIKFLNTFSKKDVAYEFGFQSDLPAVLIMGGGLGIGKLDEIAQIIDSIDMDLQIIVVCGNNKRLYNWFKNRSHTFRHKIFYFGYVDFVYKLMDFSDIIVTKAGGLTLSEALAKGLAIILLRSIPGQEERNINFLLEKKAIIRIKNNEEIKYFLRRLLEDKKALFLLKEKAKRISIIDSSLRIADLVLSYV